MWVFTKHGFFSAVEHRDDPTTLILRCRVRNDLNALRRHYFPTLTRTKFMITADYPYRATITKDEFAKGMARVTEDLTYDNFKNAVALEQGHERYTVYSKVWSTLWELETDPDRFNSYLTGIPQEKTIKKKNGKNS